MFSTGNNVHRKRALVRWGFNRNTSHNIAAKDVEEDCISSVELNYGNRLLGLRAALNEKELQLVELREQHLSVVNRAAIARKNWEDAITSKDQVIVQLQKAFHLKKCELERQERVNEENVRRLLHQRQEEEKAELLQKQRNISLLEEKNTQFVEELVEQQKTITKLRRQLEDKERHRATYLHKMEVVNVRVQDLKAALQKKEEAVETQKKYCQDLKGMLWKRDAMIGQLQLAEQQLQSSLARQEAEHEALRCLKEKLEEEKAQAEKGLLEKEVFLHKQRRQIHDLRKTLQSTEIALTSKHEDRHHLLEVNNRLVNSYESLRDDFEHAQRKQQLLELHLKAVQERLSTAERIVAEAEQSAAVESMQHVICTDGSIVEDQAPNNGVEDFDEERQSMASIGSSVMELLSAAENIQRRSKTNSCQTSGLLKASCPSIPSVRDKVSFRRGQENPRRLQTLRTASAEGNDYLSTTECTKVALYPSFLETANKTERKSWTVASTKKSYSYPSGTNIPLDQTAEARTSILSESSQRSSPGTKAGLVSSSEIDGMTGGDRSSTPLETFQTVSLAERKKTSLTSINNSRKGTSSLEAPCTSRPAEPLSSAKEFKLVPNLKIPRSPGSPGSPEQSEISGSLSLEFQSCSYPVVSREPKAGNTFNQGKGYSPNKLIRPLSDVPKKTFQTVMNPPATRTQFHGGRSSKKGKSVTPSTPASIKIQASCDTALKSLQDEVMKRERGWRRTEANMRAALCQRLTELKNAEKLNTEMVGLCQRQSRQKIKQWKA